MSRYTGPSYKKARRVGFSISETGKELAKRPYGPGQHGQSRKRKLSNYGVQLKEKQKVRFMYGLNERQFRKTFDKAAKMVGIQGENFLKLLESRLDSIVYRMGLSNSRRGARQLVNHGHILVDGKKVDIPSFSVKVGSTISVKENSKDHPAIKAALENITKRMEFVTFDNNTLTGNYIRMPERNELNADIDEALIVEFYNR
ncbi:MAG: 30S ribosomal protein S4 [Tenericutes bacterium]|jgi:small subunit ribosomal protein S4|nr:30S ribosomal protein S4 [Mycoplasmatota bacterium]